MLKQDQYNIKLINTLYNHVPTFTDVFDEDMWFIFAGCFVAGTLIIAFFISRFVTIKPVD